MCKRSSEGSLLGLTVVPVGDAATPTTLRLRVWGKVMVGFIL